MSRLHQTLAIALPAVFLAGVPRELAACQGLTVRDAAFQGPRDVHRLTVIAASGDESAEVAYDRLAGWLRESGSGLNLELRRAATDDPQVRWQECGLPSAPPESPVVVLAGHCSAGKRTFFIDYWQPSLTADDWAVLRTSPVREMIQQEVRRRLAVLLCVTDSAVPGPPTESAIQSVIRTWSAKVPLGVSLVRVNRSDDRERLLLTFIGARKSGPDWVAVVFGRGKFLPPLEGEEITEGQLNEQLELLAGECTCLRSPANLGTDIPMNWNEALDATVVPLHPPDDDSVLAEATPSTGTDVPFAGRAMLASILGTLVVLFIAVAAAAVVLVWRKARSGQTAPDKS
jgi:hypothetical protein